MISVILFVIMIVKLSAKWQMKISQLTNESDL